MNIKIKLSTLYRVLEQSVRYIYYLLFFFTPLVMSSRTSEIFEFNKMMLIYFCALLATTLWALVYLLGKPKSYKPLFLILLLIFFVTQILSAVYSIDPHTSIFGYYGRWNGGLLSIISYIALFFVFVQVFTKKHIASLFIVSMISSVIVSAWGLLAKYGFDMSCLVFTGRSVNTCWTDQFQPAERIFSTVGQPNWLGAYLAIHFFIALYLIVKSWKDDVEKISVKPYLYSFSAFVIVLTLYFTKSRSALVAFAIAVAVGFILLLWKKISIQKSILFTSIVGALFLGSVLFLSPSALKLNKPTYTQLNVTDSFDIRKIVWKGAIDLGMKYPFFGSGVETFAYAYYFTRPLDHNRTSEWDFIYNKAHNEYLNYFATTGFVGLAGYLMVIGGILGLFFLEYKKQSNTTDKLILKPSYYIFLSFITILITNFSGFSVSVIQLFFYIIPAIFLVELGYNKKEMHEELNITTFKLMHKIAFVTVILVGTAGLFYFTRYYMADRRYAQAKNFISISEYGEALVALDDALKLKYEHVYEDKISNVLAYLAFQRSFDDKERAQNLIMLSKVYNYRSLSEAPENILYWKTRARNYYLYYQVTNDINDLQNAVSAMEKATKIAPTDVQTQYSLAVLYVSLSTEAKDQKLKEESKQKGKATLSTIFKMKPDYREAQELNGTF